MFESLMNSINDFAATKFSCIVLTQFATVNHWLMSANIQKYSYPLMSIYWIFCNKPHYKPPNVYTLIDYYYLNTVSIPRSTILDRIHNHLRYQWYNNSNT